MPRYKFTQAQRRWIETSNDPLAKNLRTLFGMYNAPADHVCIEQLDAAVKELGVRWPEIMKELSVRRKTEHQQRVEKLMAGANQHVPDWPTVPDEETRLLRARLILEEAIETIEALGCQMVINREYWITPKDEMVSIEVVGSGDLEEIADGCADVIVVTTGTLSACGIADDSVQTEVDMNNLRKFEHHCPKCDGPGQGDDSIPWQRVCHDCGEMWISGYSREDGKWVKPSNHPAPRIADVIDHQTEVVERG